MSVAPLRAAQRLNPRGRARPVESRHVRDVLAGAGGLFGRGRLSPRRGLTTRAAPADRREPRGRRLAHARPGGDRRRFPRLSRVRRFVTVRLRVDGFFERISRRSLVPAPRVGHRRQPRLDLVQVPSSRRSCRFVRHRSPFRLRGCKVRRLVRVHALHGSGDDAR